MVGLLAVPRWSWKKGSNFSSLSEWYAVRAKQKMGAKSSLIPNVPSANLLLQALLFRPSAGLQGKSW
jgi:hypothetical protein